MRGAFLGSVDGQNRLHRMVGTRPSGGFSAQELGANAIIGIRCDANDMMDGVTEVPAYGTAVVVEQG